MCCIVECLGESVCVLPRRGPLPVYSALSFLFLLKVPNNPILVPFLFQVLNIL